MKRILLFCWSLYLFLPNAFAQEFSIRAEASAQVMGIEDQIWISYTIENVNKVQFLQNPQFPNFKVVDGPQKSRGESIQFSGNQGVRIPFLTITYVVQASKTGSFTLPPITGKDAAGNAVQSNALSIKVVQGSLARQQQANDPWADFDPWGDMGQDPMAAFMQQQARLEQMMQQMMQQAQGNQVNPNQQLPEISEKELGKNLFVRVSVDKAKAKIGEQITVTYKIYTRLNMQAQISKLPSLNGFWTQDFDLGQNNKPKLETLNGIQYNTFTLKKSALFPQQTGKLILDAAEIRGIAQIANRNYPFGNDVQFKLSSTPQTIEVEALPTKNQPNNFSGGVGQFSMQCKLDKTDLTTDESTNITIKISGTGNIKLIQAPTINLPNGLDLFDPTIEDTITGRSTIISGDKIFHYALAPRLPGDYDIAPIPFVYFNISTKSYVTLYSPAFKIHVRQGKNETNTQAKLPKDIHEIQTGPIKSIPNERLLIQYWLYWMAYVIPLLAFIGFVIWRKNQIATQQNIRLFKNKQANKIALKRLKTAKTFLDKKEQDAFYEAISKAIWLYLSDKLNIPLAQLSKETALEALSQKNIAPSLCSQTMKLVDDCAIALYGTGNAQQMNDTYHATSALIASLEENLKK
jgi:hypothetical protein